MFIFWSAFCTKIQWKDIAIKPCIEFRNYCHKSFDRGVASKDCRFVNAPPLELSCRKNAAISQVMQIDVFTNKGMRHPGLQAPFTKNCVLPISALDIPSVIRYTRHLWEAESITRTHCVGLPP